MGGGGPRGGGSDQFKSAFGDILAQQQDSGMLRPTQGRGGLFGSGMNGEDFVNVLTRAAALSQGDYAGAAQISRLIGSDALDSKEDARALRLFEEKQKLEQKYGRAATPYRTQDNAGNVWEQGPDGEFRPIFTDPNDKIYFNGNSMVRVPNTLRQGGSQPPAPSGPSPGTIEEGYRFNGGDAADPNNWTKVGMGGPAAAPRRPLSPATGAANGFVPPARLRNGAMTSGRRTPEGNALVGGVPNSAHLKGYGVDYDGPDLNALLAEVRGLPGIRKAFIHKSHVHSEGDGWNVPYYGARGTTGLRKR